MMGAMMTQYFQLSNALVDDWLMRLSGSAIKVYLAVVRKTRGWQKSVDLISISQFELMTGLCRPTVRSALDELLALGLITVDHGGRIAAYRLNDATLLGDHYPVDNMTDAQDLVDRSGKFFASCSKKNYYKRGKNFTPQKDNKINLRKKAVASDLPQQQVLNLDEQQRTAAPADLRSQSAEPVQPIARYRWQIGVGVSEMAVGQPDAVAASQTMVTGIADAEVRQPIQPEVASTSDTATKAQVKARPKQGAKAGKRWRIADAAVPEGVSTAVWQQYLAMRRSGRNRLDTQHKYFNLINKLDQLRAAGQDVNLCLDQSQQESWLGVFAVKSGYVASVYVAGRADVARGMADVGARQADRVASPTPAEVPVKVLDRTEAAKRCQDLWRMLGGGVRAMAAGSVAGVAA